jgi:hypothetical protein
MRLQVKEKAEESLYKSCNGVILVEEEGKAYCESVVVEELCGCYTAVGPEVLQPREQCPLKQVVLVVSPVVEGRRKHKIRATDFFYDNNCTFSSKGRSADNSR